MQRQGLEPDRSTDSFTAASLFSSYAPLSNVPAFTLFAGIAMLRRVVNLNISQGRATGTFLMRLLCFELLSEGGHVVGERFADAGPRK